MLPVWVVNQEAADWNEAQALWEKGEGPCPQCGSPADVGNPECSLCMVWWAVANRESKTGY